MLGFSPRHLPYFQMQSVCGQENGYWIKFINKKQTDCSKCKTVTALVAHQQIMGEKKTQTKRLWDYKKLPRTESDGTGYAAKWRGWPSYWHPLRHQEAMSTLCVTWLRTNISVKIKCHHIQTWAHFGSGIDVISKNRQAGENQST